MRRPVALRRVSRRVTLLVTSLLSVAMTALAVGAGIEPAWAAGTGGIELNPVPAVTSAGQPVTAFRLSLRPGGVAHQQMLLRNGQAADASARIYAASATASPSGEYSIGGPGTAPWIGLQPFTVSLQPGQQQTVAFTVHRPPAGVSGALVVEVAKGSITQRAATLVLVTREGADPTLPLALVVLAAALLVGSAALVYRQRGHHPATAPAPESGR